MAYFADLMSHLEPSRMVKGRGRNKDALNRFREFFLGLFVAEDGSYVLVFRFTG